MFVSGRAKDAGFRRMKFNRIIDDYSCFIEFRNTKIALDEFTKLYKYNMNGNELNIKYSSDNEYDKCQAYKMNK